MKKASSFADITVQLKTIQERMITEVKTKRQEYESEKKRISDEIESVIVNVEEQHQSMLSKVDHSKKQINKTKNQQRSLVKEMLAAEAAGDLETIKDLEIKLADLESKKMTLQAIVGSYENNEVFEVAADRNKLINLNAQLAQLIFDRVQFSKSVEDIQLLMEQLENMKETVQNEINEAPALTRGRGISDVRELVTTDEIFGHDYLNQKYDPYRPRIDKNETIKDIFNSWMRSSENIKFHEYFLRKIEQRKQQENQNEAIEEAKKYQEKIERDERNAKAFAKQEVSFGVTRY